jgi:Lrp/AsnC family leucine-responsive transcriptional regulator
VNFVLEGGAAFQYRFLHRLHHLLFLFARPLPMLDEISLKILKILQEKARIPNVDVARQVEMAPSAVLERIRKLERQGIIDGYEVRLNPAQFNRRQIAFIEIHTRSVGDRPQTGEALAALPEVQEVHYVAGADCYLVKVRVADTVELATVISEKIAKIEEVVSTRTTTVLQTYKETARIPISG